MEETTSKSKTPPIANVLLGEGLWYVVGINPYGKSYAEMVYPLTKQGRKRHFTNGINGFHNGTEPQHYWYSFVSNQKEPDRFNIIDALYHKEFLQRNYPFHGTRWMLTKSFA